MRSEAECQRKEKEWNRERKDFSFGLKTKDSV